MKKTFLAVFISFFSILCACAQNIDSNISKLATNFGQERVYLHYDKSVYAPGETIWFKAYLMKAIFPADESKSIYIDFTDDKGTLLSRSVAPILKGTSLVNLIFPLPYSSQFVHVKAYTKWMLNFDSVFLYNKDIRITFQSRRTVSKTTIVPEITFFPEGGDFIEGVNNKIAFKANDQFGRPVKIKGIIQNNNGKTLDSLRFFTMVWDIFI